MDLLPRTQELLRDRPRGMTLRKVAAGAGVEYYWLTKFSAGDIPDPGVQKVQAVHNFLNGQDK